MINAAQKRTLLEVARKALELAAKSGKPFEPSEEEIRELGAGLPEQCGAFVSLHTIQDDEIRGCVGCMSSDRSLVETVAEMAGAAALRDPRFPPVVWDEVDALEIEISVLGPLEPIRTLDDVQIGVHGLLAAGQGRRGVLLPQVATERGWDPTIFAAQTCVKAGLDADAYAIGEASLSRFSAEVFKESDFS